MKSEDFIAALSGINEKYVQDMLEDPASPALHETDAGSEAPPLTAEHPEISMKAAEPRTREKTGSRIFRYLILTASAAACIFGISRLMLLDRHSGQQDYVEDTLPTETVTTLARAPEQTTDTSRTTAVEHPAVITSALPAVSTSGKHEPAAQTVSASAGNVQTKETTAAQTETETVQTTEPFEDGDFDSVSFSMRRQPPSGRSQKGGTLVIGVVDMMTGEPIPDVTVELFILSDTYSMDTKTWKSETDRVACLTGLPTKIPYQFVLNCRNLPSEYGNQYGNWDQQMQFAFDGKTEMTVNARLIRNDAENNIHVNMYDWAGRKETGSSGFLNYANLRVTAKDGTPYYGNTPFCSFSLPDGEYHLDALMHPEPMELLKPDSVFAKYLKSLYPELDFRDQSGGIDFTVKNGKPDKDLTFNIAPPDSKSNSITVHCIDSATGEPVKGAVISVIEYPDTLNRKVAEWTSDETGTHTFDGLMFYGDQWNPPYLVRIEQVPEGYEGGSDHPCIFGFTSGYNEEIQYSLSPTE